MRIILLSLALVLMSCNGGSSPAPASSCSNTKSVFSLWSAIGGAESYDFRGVEFEDLVAVTFGEGACNTPRGDFLMRVSENGRIEFRPCSNDSTYDFASYDIECNVLEVTYDSDGEVERYH